jgi:hypothetical protein
LVTEICESRFRQRSLILLIGSRSHDNLSNREMALRLQSKPVSQTLTAEKLFEGFLLSIVQLAPSRGSHRRCDAGHQGMGRHHLLHGEMHASPCRKFPEALRGKRASVFRSTGMREFMAPQTCSVRFAPSCSLCHAAVKTIALKPRGAMWSNAPGVCWDGPTALPELVWG